MNRAPHLNADADSVWHAMRQALSGPPSLPEGVARYDLQVEEELLIDASDCNVVCTLPEAAIAGKGATVVVAKTDQSRHVITIERSSNDVIDTGSTSAALALPDEMIELRSDGERAWSSSLQRL